jgi:hypothetical protein
VYLSQYYHSDNIHKIVFAEGVVHDPVQMVHSNKGKCVIFNICPTPIKYPGHTHPGHDDTVGGD